MSRLKKSLIIFCAFLLVFVVGTAVYGILSHNSSGEKENTKEEADNTDTEVKNLPYEFTDALGNKVKVESVDRVVILYGSFAEAWINAGGELVGTTKDAVEERNLTLSDDVKIVGTVKEPNLEEIIALSPTLVILSADIETQKNFGESFESMNIPYAYMRIDMFEDYLGFLKTASDMTGRKDLYEKNGTDIKKRIEEILGKLPNDKSPKILFLRAYSTGAKAKTDDNFAGIMLKEFGTQNIADMHPSLLEELSIEEIIKEDPEYIFVTTMGDEEKALKALEESIGSNPAWNDLSAIKNQKFIVLPKELFHYKPNARWAESYEYIAKILYPEIFE